jgi:ABC-type thiamine transport system substrate-binding protein
MRFHVYVHPFPTETDKLDLILKNQGDIMALSSAALAAVQAEATAVDSFVVLFQQLQVQLAAALANTTVPANVQADIDAIFALSTSEAAKIAGATTTTPTGTPVTPAPAAP